MLTNQNKNTRVIIVGNIANYAYELGSILNDNGIESYVISDGLTHVMSQPEWLSTIDYLPSPNSPFDDWNSAELISKTSQTAISPWYIRGSSVYASLLALLIQDKLLIPVSVSLRAINLVDIAIRRFKVGQTRCNNLLSWTYKYSVLVIESKARRVRASKIFLSSPSLLSKSFVVSIFRVFRRDFARLHIAASRKDQNILNLRTNMTPPRKQGYSVNSESYRQITKATAVCVAKKIRLLQPSSILKATLKEYFGSSSFCLLGTTVSSEIFERLGIPVFSNMCLGTIRGLPFEDSELGRITKRVYQNACVSMLTNYDCTSQAERLWPNQPHRYFWALHPYTRLKSSEHLNLAAVNKILKLYGIEESRPYFLCPARHQWTQGNSSALKGNDIMIRGIYQFIDSFRGSSTKRDLPVFLFSEWGLDVVHSKKLILELGIKDYIRWIPPLPKRPYVSLIKYSLGVIDQFNAKTFGGVALDTISVGNVLISSVDEHSIRLRFNEPPSYLSASDQNEVAYKLKIAYDLTAKERDDLRTQQICWFNRNHSENLQFQEFVSNVSTVVREIHHASPS